MVLLLTVCLLPAGLRAQCEPMSHDSLPFVENFETWGTGVYASPAQCWSRFTNTGDFYSGPYIKTLTWYSTSDHGYVSSRTMFFETHPGDQWTVSPQLYLAMPKMDDVRSLTVDFKVRRPNAHPVLEVGVMEDDDTSTFVPMGLCAPSTYGTFISYSVPLSGYTGDGNRIAFRSRNAGSYLSEIYLDDIMVWVDSCATPCCLTVTYVDDSTAELSWLAVDSTADFLLTVGGTDTVVSGNHCTLEGLSPMTEYAVGLRVLCSDDTSAYYNANFQMPVAELPWHEHFDTMATPAGWKKIGGGQVSLNTGMAYDGIAALYFHEGAYDNVVLLPTFPLEVSDLYMDFFARPSGTRLWGSSELDVGYVTDDNNAGTFYAVATCRADDFAGSAYDERYVTFEGAPVGARMAMRYRGGTYYGTWLVDNIEVGDARCAMVRNRWVDSLSATTARLMWRSLGEGVEYLVAIGNDTLSVFDTTIVLNALTPDSDYVARLARLCDDGDTSAWINLFFRTECATLTYADLPYTEDFENYATGPNSIISPCWRQLTPGGYGADGRPFVYYVDSTQALLFGAYFAHCDYVVLPAVDSLAGLTLTFQAASTYLDNVYDVGVMTDHDDISTFTLLHTFSPVNAGVWEEWQLPLADYHGAGQYVAIRIQCAPGESEYGMVYLDNVTLSLTGACPQPTAVAVDSAQGTTARVTVADPVGVGSYLLLLTSSYGTDSVTITGNSHTFNGLHLATAYTVTAHTLCPDGTLTAPVSTRFVTPCAPIDTLPYRENFNQTRRTQLPPCWNVWPPQAYAPPQVADRQTENHFSPDGSPSLMLTTGFFRNNDYAILPPLDITYDSLVLSLWYRYFDPGIGTLSLGYICGYPDDIPAADTLDFHTLAVLPPDLGAGNILTLSLDILPDTATHLVIRWYVNNSLNESSVCIDNLSITRLLPEPQPVCDAPTDLHTTWVDSTSATLAWTPGGDENEWELSIEGNDNTLSVTSIPYTLSGLHPSTNYIVRLRAHCSDTLYSDYSQPLSFTTADAVGISNILAGNVVVYLRDGNIIVEGAEGRRIDIYDILGRRVTRPDAPGTYMVKIEGLPVRKIVVVR